MWAVRLDTTDYGGNPPRARVVANHRNRARETIVEAPVRDLAILAMIALLFVAVVLVMLVERQRRALEERLRAARAETDNLRLRLADATRPPTQFARLRLREGAVQRFARLRRAVPHRTRPPSAAERVRELTR